MKVLTFTSLFPSSVAPNHGIFVYQRMAHFTQRGENQVEVVAPIPFFPAWVPGDSALHSFARVPRRELVGQLSVHHPRYPLLPKISMTVQGASMACASLRLVRQLLHQMRFDCLDAHYIYPDGFAAVLLGKLLHVPTFVSARGTDINVFPNFPVVREMIRWTLRHATGAIAVSNALRDRMVSLGTSAEKLCVIGNGVDLIRFEPLDRKSCRRELGIEGDPVLLSVGSLIPGKGHDTTIRALAQLRSHYRGMTLYIIGQGGYKRKLERVARDCGVADRVIFVGPISNQSLKSWYSMANISCLFSRREGWPNVLLESLACGTPVVASNVGGIPEVVTDDRVGSLVSPENVEAAAAAIDSLLMNPSDRDFLRAFAERNSWHSVAERVEQFFASQLSRNPHR